MVINAGVAQNLTDLLVELGGIDASRVLQSPSPGRATVNDLIEANRKGGRACELVDGILVEKVMGWRESIVAAVIIRLIGTFVKQRNLGVISGSDGYVELFTATVRAPDVAFVSWDRLPGQRIPEEPVPAIAPNVVIEVLSLGNTRAEMARKRREYFHAGVDQVWMVDVLERTVAVFQSVVDYEILSEEQQIDCQGALAGLSIAVHDIFDELDRQPLGPDAS